jgi:predicted ArsR family transcriptional regulator
MDLPGSGITDPLFQPTRARLFAELVDGKRSMSADELAHQLKMHPNGIRAHLERMEVAGLVTRVRRPRPRGRPRDEWSIATDARPGGQPPRAYGDLGRWLARALAGDERLVPDVERTGREVGREIAPRGRASPQDTMQDVLSALGFMPHAKRGAGGALSFCLGNCPYRDAVKQSQEVVCTLHRGMTQGLLDIVAPTASLQNFVPRDPDLAGCLIELSGVPEPAAGTRIGPIAHG